MKIYGAGSLDDIKKSVELGVDGILTNPQGFDQYFKGEKTLLEITQSICDITKLPVFIQIHGKTSDEIIKKAKELYKVSKQVGFKIISDEKGFLAIRELQKMGINCIATTLFTISQAMIAAKVGAFGICPFVSRAKAIGMDAYDILTTIKEQYSKLSKAPEIIAVSLKGVADVDFAIKASVDAVGMRYPLIKEMMYHPLSAKAEILFAKNWANVKDEDVSYIKNAMKAEGVAE